VLVATKFLIAKFYPLYFRVGNFGKVGVGHITSNSATLVLSTTPEVIDYSFLSNRNRLNWLKMKSITLPI